MYTQLTPRTNYNLRLVICPLICQNFPLPRSARPIYSMTINEWLLGHGCVHIIYRSHYTNGMT